MSVDFMVGYLFGWLVWRHVEPWVKQRLRCEHIDGEA